MPYLGYKTPPLSNPADDFLGLPDDATHSVFDLNDGLVHVRAIRLSRHDAIGQAFLGSLGLFTTVVVAGLLAYLFSHAVYRGRGERRQERSRSLRRFLKTDMGVYVLNLLVSDLLVPLSATANVHWSTTFIIYPSMLCDVQGSLNQFGLCAAAWWNVCLASQTFVLLFVRKSPPWWLKWVMVPLGWTFALLMTFLGVALNDSPFSFFGPTSPGCWLALGSNHFFAWYLAMAVMSLDVLLTMLVMYVLLFLSLSGALKRITTRQWSSTGKVATVSDPNRSPTLVDASASASGRRREVRAVARKMLWYPASYGVLSIPLVSCVLLGARSTPLPHWYYQLSNSAFLLISLADVLIFLLTRRALLRGPATATITSTIDGPMPTFSSSSSSVSKNISSPVPSYFPGRTDPNTQYRCPHQQAPHASQLAHPPASPPSTKPLPTLPLSINKSKSALVAVGTAGSIGAEGGKTTKKGAKRGSWTERTARAQGEEDSYGLVRIGVAGGEHDIGEREGGRRYVSWEEDDQDRERQPPGQDLRGVESDGWSGRGGFPRWV